MMRLMELAQSVRSGHRTAGEIVEAHLAKLFVGDGSLQAVTHILADRAREDAAIIDAAVRAGHDPGPLAGVPYGVKDLFDVAGRPTSAGSSVYAHAAPARNDAEAIVRLGRAGAILVATLNMDEFAYGFTTVNARYGTTRNPHDTDRLAGGSSGGSAAAVAADLLPFSLGSDTNGSVRVPASITGLFGLKPTHDSLPMGGVFPFAKSFDDVGYFARSTAEISRIWEVLAGRPIAKETGDIKVARLGGRFRDNADPEQLAAIDDIGGNAPFLELPDVTRARSAALLMTAFEGGRLHRAALGRDAMAFGPAVRERLLAGALIPDALYSEARAFHASYKRAVGNLIANVDILLAPATPCVAPPVADPHIMIDGVLSPARVDLGIHTQPISFAGLPALSVPLLRPGRLPLGIQLIGRPDTEPMLFRFAADLEKAGLVGVSAPSASWRGEAA